MNINSKKVVLIILDGYGYTKNNYGNAIKLAKTPFFSYILKRYPNCLCKASGIFVGLPKNNAGNSEVGHLTIGSGRCIKSWITYINEEIKNKNFFKNEYLINSFNSLYKNKQSLHIIGLLSNGNVHSSLRHLYAIIEMCSKYKLKDVFIHAFLDGRDTPINFGLKYLEQINIFLKKKNIGEIVTIIGRYYAMDRDNNWNRTKIAYDALTIKKIDQRFIYTKDIFMELKQQYSKDNYDEFIIPIIKIDNFGNPKSRINDNDTVFFFNFRRDRAKQLTTCFVDIDFNKFQRKKINNLNFICMTNYDSNLKIQYLYDQYQIKNTIGEVLSKNNLKQLKIAESEKINHVTYFINGRHNIPFKNESRILIKSKNVKTFDLKPEMSSFEITNELIKNINLNIYDFIVVNFANMDMIGHTGNLKAAIKSIEIIDFLLKRIYDSIIKNKNYILLITSDHGNIEKMLNKNGSLNTSHTNNPV